MLMRILQVASGDFFSTYGGGQVYVKNIVDEMICRQCDVQVLSFVTSHAGVEKKLYKSIDLYEIGTDGINELLHLVERIKPDVIHAHSHKAQMVRIGSRLNIPVIVTSHHGGILCPAGTLLDSKDRICNKEVSHEHCLPCCLRNIRSGRYWYPFMRLLPPIVYKQLGVGLSKLPFIPFVSPIGGVALSIARKQEEWETIVTGCTRMVAPCHAIAEQMQRNGLDKDRTMLIPHGIPLPEYVPVFPPVVEGKIKFFYVGRICYVKGLHVLLKAFTRLNNVNAELHLIGGTGNKVESRYEHRLKKRYAYDKRIIWHGKISPVQVFDTIKDLHILVHPAIYLEVFGLNIAEALAMGKPVLATRCGGAEMQIKDGVNGWLVEPNNVEGLTEKLQEICTHFTSYDSEKSTTKVISITAHCQELIKLYEEVVADRE